MKRWDAEELAILIADYPSFGAHVLAYRLRRNVTAVRKKANRLGVYAVFHRKQKLAPRARAGGEVRRG